MPLKAPSKAGGRPESTAALRHPAARLRLRLAEATAVLPAADRGVFAFESFVDGLGFLEPRERARVKLAGSEIFDNLMHHAAPLRGDAVTVRASLRGERCTLAFYFKSQTFGTRLGACEDEREPLFDPERRRWRGIGLKMCRNLAFKIRYRSGAALDRIYLEFRP
ncbi:MAG: hypothetical protein JNG85_17300 [Spirochaetaceae bacterium]|nr:hypothetical protein [Spirochaetaceae bacterium]